MAEETWAEGEDIFAARTIDPKTIRGSKSIRRFIPFLGQGGRNINKDSKGVSYDDGWRAVKVKISSLALTLTDYGERFVAHGAAATGGAEKKTSTSDLVAETEAKPAPPSGSQDPVGGAGGASSSGTVETEGQQAAEGQPPPSEEAASALSEQTTKSLTVETPAEGPDSFKIALAADFCVGEIFESDKRSNVKGLKVLNEAAEGNEHLRHRMEDVDEQHQGMLWCFTICADDGKLRDKGFFALEWNTTENRVEFAHTNRKALEKLRRACNEAVRERKRTAFQLKQNMAGAS